MPMKCSRTPKRDSSMMTTARKASKTEALREAQAWEGSSTSSLADVVGSLQGLAKESQN
jgi:hypothetical protein